MKYEKVIEKLKKHFPHNGDWWINKDNKGMSFRAKYPNVTIEAELLDGNKVAVKVEIDGFLLMIPREYPNDIKTIRNQLLKAEACYMTFDNKSGDQIIRQRINKLIDILAPGK